MTSLTFRRARLDDVEFITGLSASNYVGPLPDTAFPIGHEHYRAAFAAIDADPNQMLTIAELDGRRVGTLQITYTPGLGLTGTWRGTLETVHIVAEERSKGLGAQMVKWAVEQCRARGCHMVQLTSNKARKDAHRFYNRLGFTQSHEGFKLYL